MKKILNFKKWIGPFFALVVFAFVVMTMNTKDPIVMTSWFVLPVLSYGFTMLYASKNAPGWFQILITIVLMALPIALGISLVNSLYTQNAQIPYIIARSLTGIIPVIGIIYGAEVLVTKMEDNFFEIIQNPI